MKKAPDLVEKSIKLRIGVFFEVQEGTVIVSGDQVKIGEKILGSIAGFDETHMPNHINIIVKAKERRTGVELGFNLDDTINIY